MKKWVYPEFDFHTLSFLMSGLLKGRVCDWCKEHKLSTKRVWVSRKTYILSDEECDAEDEEFIPPTGFQRLCRQCAKFNETFISPRSVQEGLSVTTTRK